MLLVDAGVVLFAAGGVHPRKHPSVRFMEGVAIGAHEATLDTLTLQEILGHYRTTGVWSDGRRVFDLAREVFPTVIPLTGDVLDGARLLLDRYRKLSARHALHASVVLAHHLDGIVSYDKGFDAIDGVERREP